LLNSVGDDCSLELESDIVFDNLIQLFRRRKKNKGKNKKKTEIWDIIRTKQVRPNKIDKIGFSTL
jgi:hypothetical protein